MHTVKLLIYGVIFMLFFTTAGLAAGVGDVSPAFNIKTLGGAEFDSETLKNQNAMILVFWATWCPNCKREIPVLNQIHNNYQSKGLSVLAINVGVNDSILRTDKYRRKYGISYPTAFDSSSAVTRKFKVHGTPTIIVVDKKGIIRYRSGTVPEDFDEHYKTLME